MRPATLVALAVASIALSARAASGGRPLTMTHSGYLLDANDDPLSGATLAMTFRLFDASGTVAGEQLQWQATCPVLVSHGYYSAVLGEGPCAGAEALDTADVPLSEGRWLELAVAGVTLSPRLPILAAPLAAVARHALDADALGGHPAGGYSPAAHAHVASDVSGFDAAVTAALAATGSWSTAGHGHPDANATTNGFLSAADWAAFDGKLTVEADPRVGTLSSGKWCTSDGAQIHCLSDPPAGTSGLATGTFARALVTVDAGGRISGVASAAQPPTWNTPGSLGTVTLSAPITSVVLWATDPYAAGVSYALAPGSTLPPGLSITANHLDGTPTQGGTFTFTLVATNTAGGSALRSFTLTVTNQAPAWVTAAALGTFPAGQPILPITLSATDPEGSPVTYALSAGSLPPGLTLSGATISGTPTSAASHAFTLTAQDPAGGSAARAFTLTTTNQPPTWSTGASLGNIGLGVPVTQVAVAAIDPESAAISYALTSGALPAGLSLSGATITGAPTALGTASFTVTATDAGGASISRAFTLTVVNQAPTWTSPATLATIRQGVGIIPFPIVAADPEGFSLTYALTAGSLPPGMSLAGNVLSGAPGSSGTFNFTLNATDVGGVSASRAFSITVTTSCSSGSATITTVGTTLVTLGGGCTNVTVQAWGAGGGGGNAWHGGSTGGSGGDGGGGGYVGATLPAGLNGQQVSVFVGGGGLRGISYNCPSPPTPNSGAKGAGGGGASWVSVGATPYVVAAGAGGGGGGWTQQAGAGGPGGGTTGLDGVSGYSGPNPSNSQGRGGTQSAGGAAGDTADTGAGASFKGGDGGSVNGCCGGELPTSAPGGGGRGGQNYGGGGGGGGGYFGGGGGGSSSSGSGGGGGASYTAPGVTSVTHTPGSGRTAGNSGSAGGAGQGGARETSRGLSSPYGNCDSTNGANGRVVLTWN